MSTGADPKTMPQTAAFDEGYERIFGKDHKPQRGRFIWDSEQKKFVPEAEYVAPKSEQAVNAPIMAGRFYENTCAPDPEHTDIGSRRRHREYMKERGLTTADDFTQTWAKAEAERAKIRAGEPIRDSERREQLGRAAYEVEKRGRRK